MSRLLSYWGEQVTEPSGHATQQCHCYVKTTLQHRFDIIMTLVHHVFGGKWPLSCLLARKLDSSWWPSWTLPHHPPQCLTKGGCPPHLVQRITRMLDVSVVIHMAPAIPCNEGPVPVCRSSVQGERRFPNCKDKNHIFFTWGILILVRWHIFHRYDTQKNVNSMVDSKFERVNIRGLDEMLIVSNNNF